jgi:hypothetical protein
MNRALPAFRGYIYFIAEGHTGAIKIGVTNAPAQRLSTMQVGNSRKLRVLGLILNGDEQAWHRRFRDQRMSGEWFKRTPEMTAAIKEHRTHTMRAHIRDGRTTRAERIVPVENGA